jgi:RimJ/RimL family protein N-acetyltransferase
MRNDMANRVIEMGWVIYSDALQRTRMATEAQYLVMKYVFEEMQYRRYEWKCDHLNVSSHQAALRLGFTYEGTFRQALVNKGRNRDTDWFSMLDYEWEKNKQRLEKWLSDDNFTEDGQQIVSLREI